MTRFLPLAILLALPMQAQAGGITHGATPPEDVPLQAAIAQHTATMIELGELPPIVQPVIAVPAWEPLTVASFAPPEVAPVAVSSGGSVLPYVGIAGGLVTVCVIFDCFGGDHSPDAGNMVPPPDMPSEPTGGGDVPVSPPAVPEPSAWAMMLLGFSATGWAIRFRRRAVA